MPGLFYGREGLRAPWRVLGFLLIGSGAFWPLAMALEPALERWENDAIGLALWNTALTAALLIASAIMMRWVERRPLREMGLPGGVRGLNGFLRGSAVGGGLIASLVAVEAALGWLRVGADPGTPLSWLSQVGGLALLFGVAAAAEELLFRGYPFQVLVRALGPLPAVMVSSALFGLIHAANPGAGVLAVVNIGLAGGLMAVAYLRSGSLWVAIGLHWAWNWTLAAVLDLPVSGLPFDVPGYDTIEAGPDLVTGGSFGPEAGLLMTLFAVGALVWARRTRWLSSGSTRAAADD